MDWLGYIWRNAPKRRFFIHVTLLILNVVWNFVGTELPRLAAFFLGALFVDALWKASSFLEKLNNKLKREHDASMKKFLEAERGSHEGAD